MKRIGYVLSATIGLLLGLAVSLPAQESRGFNYFFGDAPPRSWIGVSIRDITSDLMKEKNLKSDDGALISEVVRKSPADSAGLKEGDVIVKFNGRDINDAEDIVRAVRKLKPGTHVDMEIMRDGARKSVALTIARVPRERRPHILSLMREMRISTEASILGLQLSKLSKQLGEYFQAPEGRGVLVEEVEEHSSGEKAGFKAGDVIVKIGKDRVEDINDIEDGLRDLDEGDTVAFEILRKGTSKTLTVELTDKDVSYLELPEPAPFPHSEFGNWRGGGEFHFEIPPVHFGQGMKELQIELRDAERQIRTNSSEMERNLHNQLKDIKVLRSNLITI